MSLSDTSLYYPFIRIPNAVLVHSLLFKDRIKRIIPPEHAMDDEFARSATHPNKVCRQYLGYEFIESADYWGAREEIAEMFCAFLDEAHATRSPEQFEQILGSDYQRKLVFSPQTPSTGTQYFVYAHKFSERVFTRLESLGWMRLDSHERVCEMRNELCNVYMTLLAACISKKTSEPVSTGIRQAEELLRSQVFHDHFGAVIPPQMRGRNDMAELCLTLLLTRDTDRRADSRGVRAIHEILSFDEAVRIRAGLEEHRRQFCSLVDGLVQKAEAVDPKDYQAYLSLEVKDVLVAAEEYAAEIKRESEKQLATDRRGVLECFRTGVSAVVPLAGVAIDAVLDPSTAPGPWSVAGIILGIAPLLFPSAQTMSPAQDSMSSRQQAFLFMNKLWDVREGRLVARKGGNR